MLGLLTLLASGCGSECANDRECPVNSVCIMNHCEMRAPTDVGPLPDAFTADVSTPDSGPPDVGIDAPGADAYVVDACVDGTETCDGMNQDCDGNIDEGVMCTAPNVAVGVCGGASGCMAMQCSRGYADCDSDFATGCEREVRDRMHCGGCDTVCAADEVCVDGLTGSVCDGVADLVVGEDFGCIRTRAHRIYCWGSNHDGQLAAGTMRPSATPLRAISVPISLATGSDGRRVFDAEATTAYVIDGNGRLYAWGTNSNAQWGNGVTSGFGSPSEVSVQSGAPAAAGRRWVEVAAGATHACAIDDANDLYCWGASGAGQTGEIVTRTLIPRLVASNVATVDAGGNTTCFVSMAGGVSCMGANAAGQLGRGTTSTSDATPTQILTGMVDVMVGKTHVCARNMAGAHRCFGANASGEILGVTAAAAVSTPTAITTTGYGELTLGLNATCAIRTADGSVDCWGNNSDGHAFGPGDATSATRVSIVDGDGDPITGIRLVRSDAQGSCGLATNGQVWCWGADISGLLARGGDAFATATPAMRAGQEVDEVVADQDATCVRDGGAITCAGLNTSSRLTSSYTGVPPVARFEAIAPFLTSGAPPTVRNMYLRRNHMCASTSSGIFCWGSNNSGRLGDNTTSTRALPRAIVPATAAQPTVSAATSRVELGDAFSCAFSGATAGSALYCWGLNSSGQLGLPVDMPATQPQASLPAASMTTVVQASASWTHACARLANGQLFCWGANNAGQIGVSTLTRGSGATSVPVRVASLSNVSDVSAGVSHTCAVADDQLYCWGTSATGGLGIGANTAFDPALVSLGAGLTPTRVFAGNNRTCAIANPDGQLYCWGNNVQGELGIGTFESVTTPGRVGTLTGVTSVALGTRHTCARVGASGQLYCWGSDDYGQTASGRPLRSLAAAPIAGLPNP